MVARVEKCMVREYEVDQIDPSRVPVLNRSSPVASRPINMGTRSAAVAALQAVGI
jgi:hypothetical protein